MNVTKPSVEIIDMKDYDEMIRKIEKIGRMLQERGKYYRGVCGTFYPQYFEKRT